MIGVGFAVHGNDETFGAGSWSFGPLKIENNQLIIYNLHLNQIISTAPGSFELLPPTVHLFLFDNASGYQGKHHQPQQSLDEEKEEPGNSESLERFHVGYNPDKGAAVQVANLL